MCLPVARKLALIVRPAIVAGGRKTFVWSDYSAIEARIPPWLTVSPDAERVLDIFRANDVDLDAAGYLQGRSRRHPAQGAGRDCRGRSDRSGTSPP